MPRATWRPGAVCDGGRGVRVLRGWGRTPASAATVVAPRDTAEVASLVCGPSRGEPGRGPARGLIARGLGRSYGDAAQCAGGVVVTTAALGGIGWSSGGQGLVEVGAGVSLHELMTWSLPRGWFLPVTPGTRSVSVGGAVAADVHGKNHHRDGSFCRHVAALELVAPSGVYEVGPDRDPELFWATAGGMGLTGVVTRVTLQLTPVETDQMVVDTHRLEDLEAVMSAMEAADATHRYSVAWVDCGARGRRLGRGVLTAGEHATSAQLPPGRRSGAPSPPPPPRLRVPAATPVDLLRPSTVRAFNELWYRRAPRRRLGALEPLPSFFHPLDSLADWNLLYGRRGLVQYQFVVPLAEGEVVQRAVKAIAASRLPSVLAVLKRFGPADPGPLSFPREGWTLALDFPVGPPGLPALLDRLDDLVAGAGGRVYLAKDARLDPAHVEAMYPRLGELAAVRHRVDPDGRLQSDLSRRLGLDRVAGLRAPAGRGIRAAAPGQSHG